MSHSTTTLLCAAGLRTRRAYPVSEPVAAFFARWVRRPTARRYRCRAFTLVEILATLALVAIILPVAMSGISLALGVAGESRHQTEAASLAQTKMAEIVAEQQYQNASLAGDFAPDRPEYRWVSQVVDWQGTTLKELDVQVIWNSKNRERSVTLSTLVYTGTAQ